MKFNRTTITFSKKKREKRKLKIAKSNYYNVHFVYNSYKIVCVHPIDSFVPFNLMSLHSHSIRILRTEGF